MAFRLRIGALVLLVLFSTGLASAQQASKSLRELADENHIHIGAAVYTYHLNDPTHAATLSREFNMLVPEQEAKHCEIEKQQGQFDFTKFDQLVAFAESNNLAVRGHTLVWHSCMPSWITNGKFSRDQAIQLLHDYIFTMVGRYKGRIGIWDVVNEAMNDGGTALRDTPWRHLIGDDYVELAFRFAHEADPDALLFYNDYNAEGINAKSDAIYAMVKDFVARGVPINGVGLQMHITLGDTAPGGSLTPDLLGQNIKRLGDLGLQVQITEMDVKFQGKPTDSILQHEAGDYRRVLDTCLNNANCTAFVTWGVTDKYSWLLDPRYSTNANNAPLLFDDEYQPKPAYYAVLDLLARHAGEAPILTDEQVAVMLGTSTSATTEIPAPVESDPAQLAPDSVPGLVYYAPFPVTITLDGDESDWKNVPRVTLDKGTMLPPNNDTSMTFAAAADSTNLYFLADVKDSKIVYGTHDPQTEWYKEDSVEFYINATGDLKLTAYKPGVSQIGITADNITHPAQPMIGGSNSSDSHVQVYAIKTDSGYRIEAAVPLVTDVWSIKLSHMDTLGFQVHLNGASSTDRDTKLIWSRDDTQDQSWTNPSLFGELILWYRKFHPPKS